MENEIGTEAKSNSINIKEINDLIQSESSFIDLLNLEIKKF